MPELRNYFCCNGIIPGFSQSGGLGLVSAQWMVEGEPHFDMFGWDLARFGPWANKAFTKARVQDQYAHRFKIHFPNEERDAGRPVRRWPVYELQKEIGAVFGLNYGWEHPLWFAAEASPGGDRRVRPAEQVGTGGPARRMLRQCAGIIDISNFARYRITGPRSDDWLNALLANRMPKAVGALPASRP